MIKYNLIKLMVLIATIYFLIASIKGITIAVGTFDYLNIISNSSKYILVNIVRMLFSSVILILTVLSVYSYIKKFRYFRIQFINVCMLYGMEQSLFPPSYYYNFGDPNYFNFFLWMDSAAFLVLFVKSAVAFLVAFIASRYVNVKAST